MLRTSPPTQRTALAGIGFQSPESAQYDEQSDVYLVSNINGRMLDKDGNGFISRIWADGRVVDLRWIDGRRSGITLHAPKGLALRGDTLFVADIDVVRLFHRQTGELRGERPIEGATFLNALAVASDGAVYVTDSGLRAAADGSVEPSGTDAVYRLGDDGSAVPLVRDPGLNRPNGIVAEDGAVLVVTFGSDELRRVDASGRHEVVARFPRGQLDGLVRLPDGALLVTSWEGRAVYRLDPSTREISTVAEGLEKPADIGYDPRRGCALVPLLDEHRVEVIPVP